MPIDDDPEYEGRNFVGPAKKPGDLYLTNIQSQTLLGAKTEAELRRKRERDVTVGVGVGFTGPEKKPGDLYLADMLDPNKDLILTESQKRNPRAKARAIGKLESREAYLGMPRGSLSRKDSPFVTLGGEGPKNLGALFTDPAPAQVFRSIEDVQLDAGQLKRFNEMVERGEIDPDRIFKNPAQGFSGGALGKFFGAFQHGKAPQLGGSGLTLEQAINIVIDPSKDAPSMFDPTTGLQYHPGDAGSAEAWARSYLASQGLPALMTSRFPQGTNATGRLLPLAEARISGNRKQPFDPGMRNRFTLEELTLVAELVSGRSRIRNNPRDVPPAYEDTLFA